jgi:cell division septum initiation protein DivIVA
MGKSASEVRSDIEDTRQEMSETIDAIADRTSPGRIIQRRRQRMSDGWRSVRERVMGRSQDTVGSAGETAHGVAGGARDAAGSVVESARQAPDRIVEQTQGNPIAAGLIAFGGGLLVASLLPPSEAEQRVAGRVVEKAQPVRDELQRAGQEVADDLRSTAQEGAEQVKHRASEAAGIVQEDVRSSAGSVKEEAQR